MTARYRAVLAYDGTAYQGFQRQAGDTPTIQGAIERALHQVARQPVSLIGAGRTDSGVHASGQVIAFDVAWSHAPDDLQRALNANLPDDIALQSVTEVAASFHPRYDARSRTYDYTVYAAPVRQPLLNRTAWHVRHRQALDVAAMREAAAYLVGTHDFATFGQPPQGDNTVREVLRSTFVVKAHEPQTIVYTVEANAFLYRMVRRIVGALVRVGKEQLSPQAFEQALHAADNTWPNQTAPPMGLCLVHVSY